ncbi:hypothetical protein ABZ330_20780 [Streptomyces sp. NPDC006172]|uniref:hypothetical protein n=1 Tax=Streptomyces sp. NPDC006172 TaxID=3154470 RepID=UPI0033F50D0B
MLERTDNPGRFTRGLAAAVIAVTALVLAANAGPTPGADPSRTRHTPQVGPVTAPSAQTGVR